MGQSLDQSVKVWLAYTLQVSLTQRGDFYANQL